MLQAVTRQRSPFTAMLGTETILSLSSVHAVDFDDSGQGEVMMAKYLRSIALLAVLAANDNIIWGDLLFGFRRCLKLKYN